METACRQADRQTDREHASVGRPSPEGLRVRAHWIIGSDSRDDRRRHLGGPESPDAHSFGEWTHILPPSRKSKEERCVTAPRTTTAETAMQLLQTDEPLHMFSLDLALRSQLKLKPDFVCRFQSCNIEKYS